MDIGSFHGLNLFVRAGAARGAMPAIGQVA